MCSGQPTACAALQQQSRTLGQCRMQKAIAALWQILCAAAQRRGQRALRILRTGRRALILRIRCASAGAGARRMGAAIAAGRGQL